jgi:hypothetical protein
VGQNDTDSVTGLTMPKIKTSLGAKADGGDDWFATKFGFIICMPSHCI